jgi:methionyl-tRNA formyltransferase
MSEICEGKGTPGEVLTGDLKIACGSGAIRILELQRAGKGRMATQDALRGFPVPPGSVLGTSGT